MPKLYNIKNWTRNNLREWMDEKAKTQSKVQAFRADQIFYWLYQRRVESFAEMLNLGQETRKLLEDHFWISTLEKAEKQHSRDGSIKYR
ncbi:MAG TPA: 23S rRNA (adenine(2503)-C(2))-methyltransferase RlmN, partial [Deltaproteobacteria bacterium]|nr:23S rRNA (adenine(2503)-C(2))-methyltransferase RlmN [Deltaproteobacteria bacterium]